MFGCIVLLFFTPTLSRWALKFGYPEMFLIFLASLTAVGSLMGKSVNKGVITAHFSRCILLIINNSLYSFYGCRVVKVHVTAR